MLRCWRCGRVHQGHRMNVRMVDGALQFECLEDCGFEALVKEVTKWD